MSNKRTLFTHRYSFIRSFGPFLVGAVLLLAVIGIFVPHTDPEGARAWLEGKGYTEVRITGFNAFSCDEDTLTHTGFKAISPVGKTITGTVCWSPGWGNWLSLF